MPPQAIFWGFLCENKYTASKIWRKAPKFWKILRFCAKKIEKIEISYENKYTKKKIGAKRQKNDILCENK